MLLNTYPKQAHNLGSLIFLVTLLLLTSSCSSNKVQTSLYDTQWQLKSINSNTVLNNLDKVLLIFNKEGKASGSSGCNNFFTQYTLDSDSDSNSDKLSFGPMAGTRKMCPQPLMALEAIIHKEFPQVNRYQINNDQLYLYQNKTKKFIFIAQTK